MLTYQPPLGFNEWTVLSVHLVIEAAGVTQIMTRTVPPPQGGGRGPAVHALAALCAQREGEKTKIKTGGERAQVRS